MERPNIVLIMTDQQRWDTLGCYGNGFVTTPCLDRLSDEGAKFENCFTPWPLCTPARASMWTGIHAHKHKIQSNVYGVGNILSELCPDKKNVFELLQENGYETAYIGKWHLGEDDPGCFDVWDGFNSMRPHWKDGQIGGDYLPDIQTEDFIRYIQSRKNHETPFCSVMSYYPPHDMVYPPYEMFTAPEKFYKEYRDAAIPFPGYYASVSNIDHNVGKIMQALEENNLDDTIVIFLSDHGENFRARNRGHKASCTDDSIRVPLIVKWPGNIRPGTMVSELVGLEDVMPSLLEWAGVDRPDYLDGRSFVPLIQGDKAYHGRTSYYIENIDLDSKLAQRSIRTERWKLILNQWSLTVQNYDAGNTLYDIHNDPEEFINLYDDEGHREILVELILQLKNEARVFDDDMGCEMADKALLGLKKKNTAYVPLGALG